VARVKIVISKPIAFFTTVLLWKLGFFVQEARIGVDLLWMHRERTYFNRISRLGWYYSAALRERGLIAEDFAVGRERIKVFPRRESL
jgi:hypothetical protein